MVGSDITCPICKLTNQRKINALEPLKSMIECERCGRFTTRTVFLEMESKKIEKKNCKIIAWIRDLCERGLTLQKFSSIQIFLNRLKITFRIIHLLKNSCIIKKHCQKIAFPWRRYDYYAGSRLSVSLGVK